MSSECDRCGLEDHECHCYLLEIADRVERLEEGLDLLTDVVKAISDHLLGKNER
jgi:hypothetical protein